MTQMIDQTSQEEEFNIFLEDCKQKENTYLEIDKDIDLRIKKVVSEYFDRLRSLNDDELFEERSKSQNPQE